MESVIPGPSFDNLLEEELDLKIYATEKQWKITQHYRVRFVVKRNKEKMQFKKTLTIKRKVMWYDKSTGIISRITHFLQLQFNYYEISYTKA